MRGAGHGWWKKTNVWTASLLAARSFSSHAICGSSPLIPIHFPASSNGSVKSTMKWQPLTLKE